MENRLIITKQNNQIISAFFEGKNMVQVSLNAADEAAILGNIYLGKVKNIVKNINAAFIEIADGRMCYYSLAENRHPIMANLLYEEENSRPSEVKLKIGDELIVQVTKEDIKTKAPVVSSNINFTGKYAALTYGKATNGVSSKITEDRSGTG
jgi:ribonuclease G